MDTSEMLITFRNTHAAVRSEGILRNAGVGVRVMPLPEHLSAGCGVCLRIHPGELPRAEALLAGSGVGWEGLYRRSTVEGITRWIPRGDGVGP